MQNQTKAEECVAPGVTHNWEFKIAAQGYSCWQCSICGEYTDENEDAQP